MAGFTKGPWGIQADAEIWIMAGSIHVATIPRAHDADWSPQNAALIAAAPDLFEALHNTLTLLKMVTSIDDEGAAIICKQAEAALLRAEGSGE